MRLSYVIVYGKAALVKVRFVGERVQAIANNWVFIDSACF